MSTSVIIVNYNVRDLLLNCLASVYAAAGVDAPQVIVVDNASPDGSVEAVQQRFPRCEVIASPQNVGFSKANNLGLARARGEYILILNPDTVLQPNVLRTMTDYMEAHPEAGMVSCKLVTADGKLDLACRRSFPSLWDGLCRASGLSALFPRRHWFARYNLTYLDEDETYPVDAVNGAFMFCRRRAVEQVGPMDEDYFMYAEDLDWCCRFHEHGWQVVYHPAATTLHLKGASSSQRSDAMMRAFFRSNELFYRKHGFTRDGPFRRALTIAGLRAWKAVATAKNVLRRRKRTRP